MIIIGIDPGQAGGIVCRDTTDMWKSPIIEKMPETELDILCLLREFWRMAEAEGFPVRAYLERVGARPGQGAGGMWKFAEHYGNLRMALTAAGIPYEMVTPQKWQKALGCLSGGDKNVTKRRAQELFPQVKVTHWNADAILISEYGVRQGG